MKAFKKFSTIAMAVVGVIIIILGFVAMGYSETNTSGYVNTTGNYDVDGASFGGDFYTYMYTASDTIVDELDDLIDVTGSVRSAVAANVSATDDLNDTVSFVGGALLLSIGLIVLVCSLRSMGEVFCVAAPVAAAEETSEEAAPEDVQPEMPVYSQNSLGDKDEE